MSEQFKSIETTELVKIANAIRTKTGTTDKISLEDMPAKIAAIESGAALPELENEGAASDLLSGKQLIDSEGNIVEGTIATKTASNLTASGATVTVPAGYYATQATKSVATATQATPSITVNSSGLITASATQTAGYVAAGTKSGTKQLTTQAAKTITPSTSSQTAVASGVYTTGAVTVAAIPSSYKNTSDATASADEIMQGETAYVNGSKVTGTFTIDEELETQDDLIAQISSVVNSLPEASSEPVLQSKTATPSTSSQTIKPDSGYDGLSQVTINAIPSTYVKPSSTKTATTYTPTTSNQTISAGTYCSGVQTIKGDSNLKAENIAEGVSIFGVTGTHSGGGSSGTVETCTVQLSMPANYNLAYYYLENGEIKCATVYLPLAATSDLLSQLGKSMTNVVKGSFLICGESGLTFNSLNLTLSGSVEKISDNEAYSIGAVFKINGDCSITIS